MYFTLAVNGGWSTWSQWNICSLTCGGGQHYRVRVCNNPTPANGGAFCIGPNNETQTCNDKPCPVDGNWADWGNWYSCTATCGSSVTRSRSRTCTNPAPSAGGVNCTGMESDLESCHLNACPVDGNWSDWGHWSTCTATCGSWITRYRSRTCTNPAPSIGGANCMGTASYSESCNLGACPVDGNWSEWGNWSECSATCGSSVTRRRSRTCTNPAPSIGGTNCRGTSTELDHCILGACTVDGNWSDWGRWSACTATCGSSVTRSRYRTCTNPAPSLGGTNCMGTASDVGSCNVYACPVDGNWSDWGHWSACTATCGSFVTRSRYRTCTNPAPSFSGESCLGTATEEEGCYPGTCPVDGQWSLWTTWSACSETCGAGVSSRHRSCDFPRPSSNGKDCIGQSNEMLHCPGLSGPQIVRNGDIFTKPLGSRFVIDCLVLGSTPPEQVPKVIWTAPQSFGHPPLSNVVELRNGSIIIDGLTLENIGAYSCAFNNHCGTHVSANFWVNIQ
ncbi:hypothetical protein ACJMK2_026506 [Sinanodonta woodiana]|uniref:Ig-like domain-containing protein n=1 Tax=Sinanodonta woodiana TaxID=1069815 RepID=A0ABD3XJU4_SINWO